MGKSAVIDERRGAARLPLLDSVRGAAVVAMIVYHFFFDLKFYLGRDILPDAPWAWTTGAWLITSVFLFCSGAAVSLSGAGAGRFFRRQGRLAAAALVVSAVTYFVTPDWWIRFGVLHCLLFAGFICRALRGLPKVAGLLGVGLGLAWWMGVVPEIPGRGGPTLDFVPVVPWVAVSLLGAALGWVFQSSGREGGQGGWVRWAGRHSLAIYLIHQPILMGVMVGAECLLS